MAMRAVLGPRPARKQPGPVTVVEENEPTAACSDTEDTPYFRPEFELKFEARAAIELALDLDSTMP
jgi:hypothetical protein